MSEKEYIDLKRRIVYRGDVYQAINDELIKVSAYAISSEYRRGVEDGMKWALGVLAHRVKDIPTADVVEAKLLDDGTLIVTTDKYPNVTRVFVEDGKTSGSLFYTEEDDKQ